MKKNVEQTRKGGNGSETKSLIAIVDDDESARVALGSLFRSRGLATAAFASALEFLNWELSQTTCLILDVLMLGITDSSCNMRWPSNNAQSRTSSSRDRAMRVLARALRAGAASFLAKPFSEDALLTAVRSVIADRLN